MSDCILGLDIGTTTTKAILIEPNGNEIITAEQSYPLSKPEPDWAEQNPEQIWNAVVSVI